MDGHEEVSAQVNEMRTMLNSIWIRKHHWKGHVWRHDVGLGRMVGKPMRGKRILEMLEHLYENTGYEVLKKTEVRGEKA